MLEPNGRQILTIIGKGDSDQLVKGILLPGDMPAALAALSNAIAQEEALRKQRVDEALAKGENAPTAQAVSLRQRAVPFMDMLQRCHKANTNMVWGV